MNYDTSMVKYYFLNSLFLRLFPAISVEELRIVALLSLCPPFGRSVSSDSVIKGLFSSLNASTLAESRPGIYSSFRESPVSDAQQVVGHVTGLHVISIERDARAAFTLWRYPSPRRLSSDGEVRRALSDAASPHYRGQRRLSRTLQQFQDPNPTIRAGTPSQATGPVPSTLGTSNRPPRIPLRERVYTDPA